MVNITSKTNALRKAIALARVKVSKQETVDAITNRRVPKGDVFEFSRAAGLLAIKKTSDVIPDCHPLPVEFAAISFDVMGLEVEIKVEVHTIYKTGVEVEAMHGAAIVALTMYDMLKPIDSSVEISTIRLEKKSGGKSDRLLTIAADIKAAVVVCSDSISAGRGEDAAGKLAISKLEAIGISGISYQVIADDFDVIQTTARKHTAGGTQLLLFTGGTGVSPRDQTPDAIMPLLTQQLDGLMETARRYGQERMPYAMLSRGVAGFIDETLVITLPGSPGGVEETMSALFPHVLHLFAVRRGAKHG